MFASIDHPAKKKVGFITLFVVISLVIILSVPEGSNSQMLLFFLIGCGMGYPQGIFYSKLDVIFHYAIIILFGIVSFIFIPNEIQSVLFLLGALTSINMKRDLNVFKNNL